MNQKYDFQNLPHEFLCSLCHRLLCEPVTCTECLAANFCLKCAEDFRENKSNCPVCKALWCDKSLKCNPFFMKIYQATEVRCPNKDCAWEGLLPDYFNHDEVCNQKNQTCPNKKFGCVFEGPSNIIVSHNQNGCIFTPFVSYFEQLDLKFKTLMEENQRNSELIHSQGETIDSLKQIIDEQNKTIATLKLVIQGKNMPVKQPKVPVFQGILRNVSLKSLIDVGFKLGFCEPYSHQTMYEELVDTFGNKKYVILAGKEKNEDKLLIAAMGEAKEVFKETKNERECHYHNGVYWYCMKGKAVGFSFHPRIYLYNADWIEGEEHRDFEDERLSWHLTGNGGWRLGKFVKLSDSNQYEKIVLFWE